MRTVANLAAVTPVFDKFDVECAKKAAYLQEISNATTIAQKTPTVTRNRYQAIATEDAETREKANKFHIMEFVKQRPAKRNDKKASGIERAFKIIYSRRIVACSNHLLDYLNNELVSEIIYFIRNILVFVRNMHDI